MNWQFLEGPLLFKIAASVLLVALVLTLRAALSRTLRRAAPKSEIRRRWLVTIRNVAWVVIALGLVPIWLETIGNFGTAILAVAVAVVIATKELIQGVLGSFVRTATDMYSIGDRIEVGSHRGDVVDLNLFSTTILEVGPKAPSHLRTGRTVSIPNGMLLTTTVTNESSMNRFVVHTLSVPVSLDDDWKKAEAALLEAAETECTTFLQEARRHMATLEREHGLSRLPLKPRVLLEFGQPDRVNLLVRVPAPVGRQGTVEQAILRRYLESEPWKKDPVSAASIADNPAT